MQETENVVLYNFNFSVLQTVKEKVQHMYIQLTKEALSMEESVSMNTKCNIHYGVPVTLTMTTASSAATTFTFKSTVMLNSKNLMEKAFVNFTGFTQAFYDSFRNKTGKSSVISTVTFKLSISGSCYSLLSPTDLGFTSSGENHPWLVAFSINPEVDKTKIVQRLSELTAYVKNKRQAVNESAVNKSAEVSERLDFFNIESPCRMYTHWVSA